MVPKSVSSSRLREWLRGRRPMDSGLERPKPMNSPISRHNARAIFGTPIISNWGGKAGHVHGTLYLSSS
jgi:hypothetical protein